LRSINIDINMKTAVSILMLNYTAIHATLAKVRGARNKEMTCINSYVSIMLRCGKHATQMHPHTSTLPKVEFELSVMSAPATLEELSKGMLRAESCALEALEVVRGSTMTCHGIIRVFTGIVARSEVWGS